MSSTDLKKNHCLLSVVIACSRPDALKVCEKSILDTATELEISTGQIEVISAGEIASEEFDKNGVRFIHIKSAEKHANHRRNLGIDQASGSIIAFLDDDTAVTTDWLSACLKVDTAKPVIFTGPELPMNRSGFSQLIHAISTSSFSQGTKAHVDTTENPVHWSAVPFCNCVVSRKVIEIAGKPSTSIPWDMDDFEFCRRVSESGISLFNNPSLRIYHDRYPDNMKSFISYTAATRERTGEKLFTHFEMYRRVLPVLICFLLPWGALGSVVIDFWLNTYSFFASLVLYFSALAFSSFKILKTMPEEAEHRSFVKIFFLTLVLQVTTILLVQIGFWSAFLFEKRTSLSRASVRS